MDQGEGKQEHIYWDTDCPCDSCRRWKDEDTVSLTDEGMELLEALAAAAQFGEVFTTPEDIALWVTGYGGARRRHPEPGPGVRPEVQP